MASAKAKIRHVFGDTFSCRAAPPDILVELSGSLLLWPQTRGGMATQCIGSPGKQRQLLSDWLIFHIT